MAALQRFLGGGIPCQIFHTGICHEVARLRLRGFPSIISSGRVSARKINILRSIRGLPDGSKRMWDYDQLVDAIYTTVWRPQMRMRLWILGIFGEPCYIIIQRTNDEPFPFSLVYNARHGSPPQARSGINSLRNQQQNQLSERMPSQLSEAVNMVFLVRL